MKTETVEEAMELLRRYRKTQIKQAQEIADDLIRIKGCATTTEVHKIMSEKGLIREEVGNHWLGAVFRNPRYKPTGLFALGIEAAHGNAGHPVRVWTFA